jgi:hypothetical protein
MRRAAVVMSMWWVAALLPACAHAGRMSELQGHLGVGFGRLFATDSPGGSLAVGAGLDLPVGGPWRAGFDVGYDLLGTRNVSRGSFFASVDYSVFEADLLAHWQPAGRIARISFGPGLMAAHADLSVASGGGASFSDLAVSKAAPAIAAEFSVTPRRPMPVKLGVQAGIHTGFIDSGTTWTIAELRVIALY